MLSSCFLTTICSHCFQYVFIFSIWVSILSNSNQLHSATCLENEWGSLKLVHFETVRLNRGPQNKLLQNSVFNLSIFFLDIIWKLKCLSTIIQQRNSAFIWNIVAVCIIPLVSLKLVIRGYFMVHWFCLISLFYGSASYLGWHNEFIFHGPLILPHITILWICNILGLMVWADTMNSS